MIDHKYYRYGLSALIAVAFLSSCGAPRATYRLTPVSPDKRWYKGKEYARTERGGTTASAAFVADGDSPEHTLSVDVWIANGTTREILVAPEQFYYRLISSPTDMAGGVDTIGPIHAIDPEARLSGFGSAIEEETSGYRTMVLAGATGKLVGTILGAVIGGGSKSDETEEERKSREQKERDNQQEEALAQLREEEQHKERLRTLQEQKRAWESTALRKTTLAPNETIAGHVLFPLREDASYVRFFFPVADSALTIIFRQSATEE